MRHIISIFYVEMAYYATTKVFDFSTLLCKIQKKGDIKEVFHYQHFCALHYFFFTGDMFIKNVCIILIRL